MINAMSGGQIQHVKIGTAGWSIPANYRTGFSQPCSNLEKYLTYFNAVEINSSFYRSHKPRTYEKWASEVAADFSFSVKLPKSMTHELRLRNINEPLSQFADEVSGLGNKLGCVLVQLPPSLEFSHEHAGIGFALLRKVFSCAIVCEPRHKTWFSSEIDAFLTDAGIARAAVDPALFELASLPGGDTRIHYYRLHGSPKIYYSEYATTDIQNYARSIAEQMKHSEVWCIFDNTANGHAFPNALTLKNFLSV